MRCAPNRTWSGPTRVSLLGFALRPIILLPRHHASNVIFNWMFNKVNGSQETSRHDRTISSLTPHTSAPDTLKEEFSDWPGSLLSIGTFGIGASKEAEQRSIASNNNNVQHDLSNIEEELENMVSNRGNSTEDRFLDCSTSVTDPNSKEYENVSNEIKIVLSKGRDLLGDNNCTLKKKSISILLTKVFTCRGGFAPAPALELRDSFSQSRNVKLLKSILRKKIYPQNAPATPRKKYMERKHEEKLGIKEAAAQEKGGDGGKWVKTDSEFIVLEI